MRDFLFLWHCGLSVAQATVLGVEIAAAVGGQPKANPPLVDQETGNQPGGR